MILTDGYVEEQKKEFQVGKRASERDGLLFTTYCGHNPVNFYDPGCSFYGPD